MKQRQTFGNNVMIKLDGLNDEIKMNDGGVLYIDTTFDPEKHATTTGEVTGLPSRLVYTGKPNSGMPWLTDMEVQIGDRVVLYYLAVVNCFRPESYRAVVEDGDRYIFTGYQNIYAVIRDGKIIPVNGYCLLEPMEDPEWTRTKERMSRSGLQAVKLSEKSNTDVTYGRVAYCGAPIKEYPHKAYSDNGVNITPGDVVMLRRIKDIPLEYDLHAKIDGGKKYWRVQRKDIVAIYEKPVQR